MALDNIKALLLSRGTQIGRAELDNGIRADEQLFQSFADEYNSTDKDNLDRLQYTVEWQSGTAPDPSSFQPIDWQKAQSAFKEMSSK